MSRTTSGPEWLDAVARLRAAREAGVLVTVAAVRGHTPRDAGAKMVVSAARTWGTVGGGNLEAEATARARRMLAAGPAHCTAPGDAPDGASADEARAEAATELVTLALSDRAPSAHGLQCCGGEVTLLLEPLPVVPAVAVFGVGHVGIELARVLARHDLQLHLVDSRPAQLSPERLAVLADARAEVVVHRIGEGYLLPEKVVPALPDRCHVVVMTHDHAEDAALCDAALRAPRLGSLGLIGSSAKWARFRRTLAGVGHGPEALARITTPVGLAGLTGKDPATIAVGVAAALLQTIQRERTGTDAARRRALAPPAGDAEAARR